MGFDFLFLNTQFPFPSYLRIYKEFFIGTTVLLRLIFLQANLTYTVKITFPYRNNYN